MCAEYKYNSTTPLSRSANCAVSLCETRAHTQKKTKDPPPPQLFTGRDKMAQQFVQAKLKGDKVVLFIKPTCSFCITAKEVLSNYKFKPGHLECVDISQRSDMGSMQDYFLELTGARTVSSLLPRLPGPDPLSPGQRESWSPRFTTPIVTDVCKNT